jgi:tRNA-dihydrouridine synthase
LGHSIEWKGFKLGVLEMRRHYTNYFRGLPHVKPFRQRLVTADTQEEILAIFEEMATTYDENVEIERAPLAMLKT